MLKQFYTNTLTFEGTTENLELFEDLIHTMPKMQPQMTETRKIKLLIDNV